MEDSKAHGDEEEDAERVIWHSKKDVFNEIELEDLTNSIRRLRMACRPPIGDTGFLCDVDGSVQALISIMKNPNLTEEIHIEASWILGNMFNESSACAKKAFELGMCEIIVDRIMDNSFRIHSRLQLHCFWSCGNLAIQSIIRSTIISHIPSSNAFFAQALDSLNILPKIQLASI
eukprot:TRINITY_DN2518_c0_g3_i1.p1 TRINITY_DN2518_c0_g3~~TRINITY_DN2518_c0_g3_i1.p1  ORF type:complete len:175 (-),score=33.89 TRINITY_DN2518_c0_g3_i1:600-1124(-)